MAALQNRNPEVMNHEYDAVVVLTGGVRQDESGLWVPSTPEDTDGNGMLAGEWRPMAAAALYLEGLTNYVLTSGGKSAKQIERAGPDVPYAAHAYDDAMRRTVHEQGGEVAGITSEFEIDSPNTARSLGYIQLMLAAIKLERELEDQKFERVGILTSDYHVPRTRALDELVYNKWNKDLPPIGVDFRVEYLSAEDILLHTWPELTDEVETAYASPLAEQRIRNEQHGMADIVSGRYRLHGELVEGSVVQPALSK